MLIEGRARLTRFGLGDTSLTRELITGIDLSALRDLRMNNQLRLNECGLIELSLQLYIHRHGGLLLFDLFLFSLYLWDRSSQLLTY